MQMEPLNILQYSFIDDLILNNAFVSIYLKNSIRLKGHIIYHDKESIILRDRGIQMIYKKAISAISPELKFETF